MCLTLDDITAVMKALPAYLDKRDKANPYFVSEADFQHAFAITIGELNTERKLKVWLEYPIEDPLGIALNNTWYIDICVMDQSNANKCFIELKYKTRVVENTILRYQGGQRDNKAHYINDVNRISLSLSAEYCDVGYSIMLTNDHLYMDPRWINHISQDVINNEASTTDRLNLDNPGTWMELSKIGNTTFRYFICSMQ